MTERDGRSFIMQSRILLREKLFLLAHRWYMVVAIFLVGSLVGWVIAQAIPTPYRASLELYVGLDPYQTQDDRNVAEFAQFEFTNPDDYKHWQMSQLSLLVVFDDVLQETLQRLKASDAYWQDKQISDLRRSLKVYWRNAGRWRLVAEADDAEHASQLVGTWCEVVVEKMGEAVEHSRQLLILERRLSAIEQQRLERELRSRALSEVKNALSSLRMNAKQDEEFGSMDSLAHWRLWSLVAQAASYQAGWQSLLARMPSSSSSFEEFNAWVEAALALIDGDLATLQGDTKALNEEHERLWTEWRQNLSLGRGLSAALVLQKPSNAAPQVEAARPTALMLLVGGVAALVLSALVVLVSWARGEKS